MNVHVDIGRWSRKCPCLSTWVVKNAQNLFHVVCEWPLSALKWATIHHHRSRGCKTVTCQSWRSEKIALLTSRLLSKMEFESVQGRIFFGLPTLKGQSFEAPWPMMMNSGLFESPKSYLFALSLKISLAALLRYNILAQTIPISYMKWALLIL